MAYNTKHRLCWAALLAAPLPAVMAYADSMPRSQTAAEDHVFSYHQPSILGTSLDLKLVAPAQSDADACEKAILQEIDRLRILLSTYDPQSEISRFQANPSSGFIKVSDELHSVLLSYQLWHIKSGGVYSAQLSELNDLWAAAEKKGAMPSDQELAPLVAKIRQNAFVASNSDDTVRKISPQALNIDSLGKGFIVQQAAAAAKAKYPAVTGILLNIGGDITALGFSTPPSVKPPNPWEISVADPQQPAANARPITTLHLSNKAVATSGAYERFYTFGDKKFSHILNPLTGKPTTNGVLSATVVAPDNSTANALATILCVLPDSEGIKLVERTSGAAALIVTADGKQVRSKNFSAYETIAASGEVAAIPGDKPSKPPGDNNKPAPSATPAGVAAGEAWPRGFQLAMDMTLLQFGRAGMEPPYTAVWIEDGNGKCVRILAAWIGNKRYLASLRSFYSMTNSPDFATMTRASRRVGEYTLMWDGLDASNNPVPCGTYTLCIEVAFHHGAHDSQTLPVTCGDKRTTGVIPATPYWNQIPVVYGPGR